MTYSVTLSGVNGISESSLRQAERAFRIAIEHAIGLGENGVTNAYQAYTDILQRYGGTPLPLDVPAVDREAVEAWEDAYGAGLSAAFVGWLRAPENAHFEVSTS